MLIKRVDDVQGWQGCIGSKHAASATDPASYGQFGRAGSDLVSSTVAGLASSLRAPTPCNLGRTRDGHEEEAAISQSSDTGTPARTPESSARAGRRGR